jgi:hypothetical protein
MKKKRLKGGAPRGNRNAVKLQTPQIRQRAYLEFCAHLSKGRSSRSFTFEHPAFTVTGQTIEKMVKDEVEFPPIHREIAEAKCFRCWEQVVMDSATGKNRSANTASLQMIMRNKFGWDKESKNKEPFDDSRLKALSDFFASINSRPSVALSDPEQENSQLLKCQSEKLRSTKTNFP